MVSLLCLWGRADTVCLVCITCLGRIACGSICLKLIAVLVVMIWLFGCLIVLLYSCLLICGFVGCSDLFDLL